MLYQGDRPLVVPLGTGKEGVESTPWYPGMHGYQYPYRQGDPRTGYPGTCLSLAG